MHVYHRYDGLFVQYRLLAFEIAKQHLSSNDYNRDTVYLHDGKTK